MLAHNTLSYLVALSLAVSAGIWFRADEIDLGKQLQTLSATARGVDKRAVIALGSNVCVDLIAQAADVLASTAPVAAIDEPTLRTEADLLSTFAHYMKAGAAAERSCDSGVFSKLVGRAGPRSRRNLGGNAALMARKLSSMGVTVLLGGQIGPDASAMLPSSIKLATAAAIIDEVHLIAEYSRGEHIDGIGTAPRANRFIITADLATNMDSMIATIRAADEAKAHVIVIAGLHMLEPLAPEIRARSLSSLETALRQRAHANLVHIELASSADRVWTKAIADALFPVSDSVGLNEQEGTFLFEALGGVWANLTSAGTHIYPRTPAPALGNTILAAVPGRREDVAGAHPRAVSVAGMLRHVVEVYPSLTRVHFHALAMHMTAYRGQGACAVPGANKSGKVAQWAMGPGATAAGSASASTEACNMTVGALSGHGWQDRVFSTSSPSGRYNTADWRRGYDAVKGQVQPVGMVVQKSSAAQPVITWSWDAACHDMSQGEDQAQSHGDADRITFYLAPVVACKSPASTVGLGDAISASGLAADLLLVPT